MMNSYAARKFVHKKNFFFQNLEIGNELFLTILTKRCLYTRDFQMVDGIEFYPSLHLAHLQNNCKGIALKTSLFVCSVLS